MKAFTGITAKGAKFQVTGHPGHIGVIPRLVFDGTIEIAGETVEILNAEPQSQMDKKLGIIEFLKFDYAKSPTGFAALRIDDIPEFRAYVKSCRDEFRSWEREERSHQHTLYVPCGYEARRVLIDDRHADEEIPVAAKRIGATEESVRKCFEIDLIEKAEILAYREDADRAKKAETERFASLVTVREVKRGFFDGGEETREPWVLVDCTSVETGETLQFRCRNIFDFGYVVNPNYPILPGATPGGLCIDDEWSMGKYSRKITEFEKICLEYLSAFPPLDKGIRM